MIIQSLLDTDLYKFTMMQVVLHHFPGRAGRVPVQVPQPPASTWRRFAGQIREEVAAALHAAVPRRRAELSARPCASSRATSSTSSGCSGSTRSTSHRSRSASRARSRSAIKGPWLHTILFEIPVLAIVNEVYFRNTQPRADLAEGRRRLRGQDRAAAARRAGCPTSRSPTTAPGGASRATGRRKCCRPWQARSRAASTSPAPPTCCSPCSNGLMPLGTMAHEYMQACQALGPRLRDRRSSPSTSGRRSTAATSASRSSDIYGMNAFLRDFDMYFCKLFDGARHDSRRPVPVGRAHDRPLPPEPRRSA